MAKVTVILTQSVGTADRSYNVGEEYECASAEEAERFIERGIAKPKRDVKVERAVKKPKGKETTSK